MHTEYYKNQAKKNERSSSKKKKSFRIKEALAFIFNLFTFILITVVFSFERTLFAYTKIFRLCCGQFIKYHTDF